MTIATVFACVIFPAADARGALLFAEWATIDGTNNTASGSIGPVAVTFSGTSVSGNAFSGVTDNSFTGFDNAVFAPPLPASDSVNFVTTLSRFIYTITFAPAVTDPRLHLYSHTSLLTFSGTTLTKLSGQDSFVVAGNQVLGAFNSAPTGLTDANGTVQLNGTFTSVTFTAENFFGNDATALQIGADIVPDSILFSGDSGLTVISMPWVMDLSGDLTVINNPNLLDINFGGLMTVGGDIDISGNTSATAIDMGALTSAGGGISITDNTSATAIDMGALTSAGGGISITDNTSATAIDMGALTSAGGGISITDNTSATAIDMGALTSAGGGISITGNTSATAIDMGALTSAGGGISITGNTSATAIDMGALTSAGGGISITGNTSATAIDMGALTTVGGDMTIETTGSGTFDVDGADVEGDTSLTTDGYSEVAAKSAKGETAVTMLNSAATMELVLRTGAFPLDDPVTFSVQKLPGGGVETVGGEIVTHLETYAFDFAIPTLNLAATLNFEINLLKLAEPARQSLLDLLHDGALLTLGVLGDAPGSELQLFDVCAGGGGPEANACVVVEWLDENRMLLDPLSGIDPSILRLEGLVGHFSTYSFVAVSHTVPEPASLLLVMLATVGGWISRHTPWRVSKLVRT